MKTKFENCIGIVTVDSSGKMSLSLENNSGQLDRDCMEYILYLEDYKDVKAIANAVIKYGKKINKKRCVAKLFESRN
jgi:hypothetical protein